MPTRPLSLLIAALVVAVGAAVVATLPVAPPSPAVSAAEAGVVAEPGRPPGLLGSAVGAGATRMPPSVPAAPEAGAGVPEAPAGRARWLWPLSPVPEVARPFVAPATPYGPGHRGIDLVAMPRAEVTAVDAGVVTHAGSVAGRGTVTLSHPSGLVSTYEPVQAAVTLGDRVAVGQVLGVLQGATGGGVGTTGHCGDGGCLHLGARRGAGYVDPLPLLRGGRPVLLPLPAQARG